MLRPLLAPRDRAPTRFLTTYTIPSAKLCFKSSFTSTISHMNHRNTADMFTGSFAMTLKLHQFACCETGHSSSNGRASCRAFTGWLYVMKSHSTPQNYPPEMKSSNYLNIALGYLISWMAFKNNILGQTFQNHKLANAVLQLQTSDRTLVIKINYFREQEGKGKAQRNQRFQNSNKICQNLSVAYYGQQHTAVSFSIPIRSSSTKHGS